VTAHPAPFAAALADRYAIVRELGAGGMATVYLARDLRHERQVAIKVLKPELAAVLGGDRFVQEIKTTAQLQHPHILPLFDSGEAAGFLYYVMPYIQGETIRERLDRDTQFGIEEALRVASQVADALDYAHRQGVIHRDIKPENILLHDGRPMVMDFGIALAVSAAAGGRMTETGLSLGTPHYMSPEQATADKAITARSDVYALASVLYEMLTGEPPHLGTSAQQIIMKIITEPARPADSLRRSIPPHVSAALAMALEKLPADRFASARAFADALANPAFRGSATAGARTAAAGRGRAWYASPVPYAAALAVAVGGLGWQVARRDTEALPPMRFVVKPPAGGLAISQSLATGISADGRRIVFRAQSGNVRRLYVQDVGTLAAREVPGTEEARYFALSPDGRTLVFQPGTGGLRRLSVDGGAALDVPLPGGTGKLLPSGVTWSGNTIIASLGVMGLVLVPADGAPARTVRLTQNGQFCNCGSRAVLTADGQHLLLVGTSLLLAPSTGGEARDLGVQAESVVAVRDGLVIYVTNGGQLMAATLDTKAGTLGQPLPLDEQVTTGSVPALAGNGTLVAFRGTAAARLELVDEHGVGTPVLEAASVLNTARFPRFSPDGRRIAVATFEVRGGAVSTNPNTVSVIDVAAGTFTRLSGDYNADRPEWSPDGTRLLFRRYGGRNGVNDEQLWWQPYDRSAPAVVLQGDATARVAEGVLSPDGRWLLYRTLAEQTGRDIWYRAMTGDTAPQRFEVTEADELMPRFSPNSQWVAYTSNESGVPEVFVRPFPGPGGRTKVSAEGGSEPVWAPDGRRLYYLSGNDLLAATLATDGGLHVVSRQKLFAADVLPGAIHANFDVSPDGRHFLMARTSTGQVDLTVALNWMAEVRRRAGR
jgi:Tol biopolymer transport system component